MPAAVCELRTSPGQRLGHEVVCGVAGWFVVLKGPGRAPRMAAELEDKSLPDMGDDGSDDIVKDDCMGDRVTHWSAIPSTLAGETEDRR